jgi:putative transposase
VPTFIRSDNGPEFVAKFLMNVLKIHGIKARHIDPGSPWQNGIDERFNGTLRDECLSLETFHHRDHAHAIVKLYKRHYNDQRPHSSLGDAVTPNEFHEEWKQKNAASQETKKDGYADGGGIGLTHCAPDVARGLSDVCRKERGLAEACSNQPERPVIHVGARVAP